MQITNEQEQLADRASLAEQVAGPLGPPRVSARQLRELLTDDMWLDELIDRAEEGGVSLTGEGGFLPEMIKAVLERGLAAELTGHLGYEVGTRLAKARRTAATGTRPRRSSPRSGRCRWRSHATATAASSRG